MSRMTKLDAKVLLARLGWPGLVGLLMGAAGTWGAWQVLPAWRASVDEDEAQVTHLRRQLQRQALPSAGADAARAGAEPKVTKPDEITPALVRDTWSRTWAALPTRFDAVARQGAVLSLAGERGVAVPTVQYRGGPLNALPSVWRQQMVLPVEAPYPALRAWLGAVLQDRAISLDALEVVRADPMGEQVKARIALSVWWRQEAR